ncbi:MAG: hypothetical protein ISS57_15340 [Anaerolineales bacterium]|nr:hypothetical protein [Anaerolineales bacterium]
MVHLLVSLFCSSLPGGGLFFYPNLAESKDEGISNIQLLLRLDFEKRASELHLVFLRMLYATVVTLMETYLSDAFMNTVLNDKTLVRKLVNEEKEFSERKTAISDIFERYDNIEEEVAEYLSKLIYHRIPDVSGMYKRVLAIEFPNDLGPVIEIVKTRHDIVHRNGKTIDGNVIELTNNDIEEVIDVVSILVRTVEDKLRMLVRNIRD